MLKISKDNFLKVTYIVLIACLCCLGVYLRTLAYLQHTQFFIDEAALALTIIDNPYFRLFGGLDYSQAAPPFYCIFCKFWASIFPAKDFVFKLIPYISSIFSVIAFVFLSRTFLKNRLAVLFAVLVFCINPQLIFMSQFYKPYITDVLITVLLIWLVLKFDFKSLSLIRSFGMGLLFAFVLWCSYPALFVVSGVSLVFLLNGIILRNKEYLKKILVYGVPILASFITLYFVNLRILSSHQGLYNYWHAVFFPSKLLDYQILSYFFFEYSGWLLFVILFLLGIFFAIKDDKLKFAILASPVMVAMLAGALHIYPFANRLVLFILPLVILILAKPLDIIRNPFKPGALFIIGFSFLFVNLNISSYCVDVLKNKKSFISENSKVLYQLLKKEIKPDEKVYVHHYNYLTFTFYNKELNINKKNIIDGMVLEVYPLGYIEDLNQLPKKTHIWFVLTDREFSQKELGVILPWIQQNCIILKKMETLGTILIYGYRK